ncbi:uncharacterized protein LOC127878533 [Dreissena polymorpha]|nr:uncharacterized protein LOC127878533 [Dreissena polymorpha]
MFDTHNNFSGPSPNIPEFWIGCFWFDFGNGYQAYWTTDTQKYPLTWANWDSNEPSSIGKETCTCVNQFKFRTSTCSKSYGILCEKHDTCPNLTNGSLFTVSLSNGQELGSIAEYTCLPGYHTNGELTRSCQMNGSVLSWSGMEVECALGVDEPISTAAVPGASRARPLFLMPCLCYPNKTFAGMTEEAIIALLVRDTAIRTNETIAAIFKKKCREDARFSSKVIGLVSSSVMISMLLLVVLSDCCKLRQDWLRIHG